MNWYIRALKNYADFSGRARRLEYWMFILFNIIVSIILTIADGYTGTLDPIYGVGILSGIYTIGVIIPSIAVMVRRLHDSGRSGWFGFLMLLPLIGWITVFVFLLIDSQPGENAWGANPKGIS